MATAIQRRRGNTAQHASFTGLAGEITIDTDKNTVVVHDGVTAGGYPLAKADDVEALGGADITAVIAGSGLTGGASSGNATISLNYENLAGNLVPSANNTYSLGTAAKVWKDVFVGPGSLYVNGQKVLADNSGTITVSADAGQNLALVTSAGGDLELSSGATGDIQLKSNVVLSSGKTITATGGLKLASNLDVNSQYINNVTNPVQPQDAATKHYVDNDATVVRVTGTQTIGGAKTFSSDLVVSGNLTVSGTTTTVNSETISLADNLIDLNSNFTTGSPTENAGIRIKRGDSADVQVRWNETDDKWQFTNDGSTYQNMLTDSAARALLSASGDLSYNSSTGVISYTTPTTDGITEGSTNLYFTNARARAAISVSGDLSYDSATGVISFTNDAGDIESVTAGSGLTGGGTSGAVTLNIGAGAGITVNADNVAVNTSYYDITNGGTGWTGNLEPSANNTYSLGSETNVWKDVFVGPNSIRIGGVTLGLVGGVLQFGGANVAVAGSAGAASDTRALFSASDVSGDGSFSYNSATGVFTYTGPSASEVRAHFSAGTGVTISSGQISIGQDVGTTDNVTFNSVTADLTGDVTGTVSDISNHDTDDLAEGNNLYFTSTRVRSNISVTDNGGDGSLSYDNSTGIISYTGPGASDYRAAFSAGTGVTLSSGQISIGQAVGTSDNVTFGDLTVSGNLTVSGSTTTVNTETINLADNKIVLNSNYTGGSPSEDGGIEVERGTEANKTLLWNETDDKWTVGSETFVAGTFEGNLTGDVTGTVSDISNHDTADLAEGTNLYFTAARARSNISVTDNGGDGSLSYDSSTGVISYTGPSQAEANTRIDARLSGGTGVTYTSGVIAIGQAVGTTDSVTFDTVTADLVGNVTGDVTGNAGTATKLATARTITLSGDVTGSATFDGSANATITTTIAANSIALGTDTVGDYVSAITAGTGLSSTGATSGENISHTLSLAASGVTAGTYGSAGAVPSVVVDTYGRVTSASNVTISVTSGQVSDFTTAVRGNISVTDSGGDGSLSYNSGTGVITYTGPSQSEANARIDARLSGTSGVDYTSGVISLASSTAGAGLSYSSGVLSIASSAAGAGLTLTSGVLAVGAGTGISVAADTVGLATSGVTAGVYGDSTSVAQITVDAYGRITSASNVTIAGDITAVTAGSYLTGGGSTGAVTLNVDATTTATANKVAARDASGDLYANIFQGTASSARYADLAERYEADAILEPGTVVCFGGEKEITACDHENDHAVAGVVSTDPAYMMNSAAGNNDTHPYIALTGRVPVKVVGPVAKGDLLVASGVKGHAMANNNAKAGTIIGKAIGSSDSGEGVVEALINLM